MPTPTRTGRSGLHSVPLAVWSCLALTLLCILPAGDSRGEDPSTGRTYAGYTVDEWRARIKSFNLDDPGIASEVPGLVELTRDTTLPWFTRRQAALTLGRIGEPAASAVPVIEAFLHPDGEAEPLQTQLWAMKSLALFGPIAADAAATVADILQDRSTPLTLRLAAVEVLGQIGTAARQSLPGLIATLRGQYGAGLSAEEQTELQIAAADILMLLRSEANPAVPALIRAAQHPSPRMRRVAATTLGTIGPRADAAIPVLGELILFDDAEDVRDAAAIALGGLGAPAIPALVTLLQDQDVDVRWRAADALGTPAGKFPRSRTGTRPGTGGRCTGGPDHGPGIALGTLAQRHTCRPDCRRLPDGRRSADSHPGLSPAAVSWPPDLGRPRSAPGPGGPSRCRREPLRRTTA